MNSKLAVVNGNMMKASVSLPFVSTSSTNDYRIVNTQSLSNSQIYIDHEKSKIKLMSSKSKDYTKDKDLIPSSQSNENYNTFIYEIDAVGRLVLTESFTQDYANPKIVFLHLQWTER